MAGGRGTRQSPASGDWIALVVLCQDCLSWLCHWKASSSGSS
nr:MAG: hypothetical protein [Microvirus sp.]